MGRWRLGVMVLALATGVSSAWAARARDPVSLSPSEPWRVHYADDSCLMMRAFGQDKDKVSARFEQTAPGHRFSLTLVGKSLDAGEPFIRAATTFLPVGKRAAHERVGSGTTADSKLPLLIFESVFLLGPVEKASDVDSYDWTQAGAVEDLLVEYRGKSLLLKFGRMEKVLAAMDACTDELLTHWGLDAAAQRTLRQPVKPLTNPGNWLRSADFPSAALAKGSSAIVQFRLTVDATGKVIGCAIPSATLGPEFAKATCSGISRRARFDPALDKDGKPVASYYVSTVKWVNS